MQLRARVGMVFQKPNPFPKSIYDNVAYGPKIHGLARTRAELDEIVERCLRRAALWDEVKDRLNALGSLLSGGQQQRLAVLAYQFDHRGDVVTGGFRVEQGELQVLAAGHLGGGDDGLTAA